MTDDNVTEEVLNAKRVLESSRLKPTDTELSRFLTDYFEKYCAEKAIEYDKDKISMSLNKKTGVIDIFYGDALVMMAGKNAVPNSLLILFRHPETVYHGLRNF